MPISDKEQMQLFQTWWKKYGYYIVFSVVALLVINFGWSRWQHYKNAGLENAVMVYTQMSVALDQQKKEEVKLFGDKLMKDYASSSYASLAALLLAKDDVLAGDLKSAQEKLQFVIKKSPSKILRQFARVRAARVLIAMKQPAQALDLLTTVDYDSYEVEVSEVFGDALMALGRVQEAENAYRKAQKLSEELAVSSPLLKVKLQQF